MEEAEPLMGRVVEIFLRLTAVTGDEYPHLRAAIENYTVLLQQMVHNQAQVKLGTRQDREPFRYSVWERHIATTSRSASQDLAGELSSTPECRSRLRLTGRSQNASILVPNRSVELSGDSALRVISRRRLREFWEVSPEAKAPLEHWYNTTRRASWRNLVDVRETFRHADPVGTCTVFNIKGNDYRLITRISYTRQRVYVRFVLTHAEYDKDKWK